MKIKTCSKCGYKQGRCICDLALLNKIGEVSACQFYDEYISYEKGAGSPFFQGWAYKHQQVKKLNHEKEKYKRLLKLVFEQHHDVIDQFIYEEIYNAVILPDEKTI